MKPQGGMLRSCAATLRQFKNLTTRAKDVKETHRNVDPDGPVLNQTGVLTGSSAFEEVAVRFWRSDVGHAVLAAGKRNDV